ncbi:hypothetical protein [Bradyrhizobium sp. RDM4]|uniref:hypothetical protein n=1 Tax=Bradyrhizobium sp. RDM4 TaxID=3378765 RepID=UPI0038FC9A6A
MQRLEAFAREIGERLRIPEAACLAAHSGVLAHGCIGRGIGIGYDRINAVLAAAGYNFSLLRHWFKELLRVLLRILCRRLSHLHLA